MAYWSDAGEQLVDYDPLVINGLPWYWWRSELATKREARFGKSTSSHYRSAEQWAPRHLSRSGYFQEREQEASEQTQEIRVLDVKNQIHQKQIVDSHEGTIDWKTQIDASHRKIMQELKEKGYTMGVDIDEVSRKPRVMDVEVEECNETHVDFGICNPRVVRPIEELSEVQESYNQNEACELPKQRAPSRERLHGSYQG